VVKQLDQSFNFEFLSLGLLINAIMSNELLTVALAQLAPVWLDRRQTLEKILAMVNQAIQQQCQLVVFGETVLPGYPFWVERTDGARFNSPLQKELYSYYVSQAVEIAAGHLDSLCELAAAGRIAIYLGCAERATDRGGHSVYASLVYINAQGKICSVHRKLMPTYDERLTWATGDGHGLQTHKLGAFTVGGLNCWENWMPLPRAALYAMGETLHVAVWPGSAQLTQDITRFIAQESRAYVISVSGLMRPQDMPVDTPYLAEILAGANGAEFFADGGSCLAAPNGQWVIAPCIGKEGLFTATLDPAVVRQERQNFDPAGHYSRPDVTKLHLNRERQSTLSILD
jgi:nitrilase